MMDEHGSTARGKLQQMRMSAVQPSRHTVACGGWLFVGPSLFQRGPCAAKTAAPPSAAAAAAASNSKPWLGSREMPLILAAIGSCLVFAFVRHVAPAPVTQLITLALWIAALVLTVRVSCRDPGVLPRAWQVTQCPRLSDQQEKLIFADQTAASPRASVCLTCCVVRPVGASHCSCCDACVAGFDHHCFWLGCCIGERNHPDFVLLLFQYESTSSQPLPVMPGSIPTDCL